MESLNYLLSNKFEFKRSIWIAFGHDEEVGGADGASNIAKTFADKGITKFEYLLDEGLVIFNSNFFPGIKRYFAIVGVSEKGTASVVMNASTGEGHSSTPAEETAITVLARAVSKLTASCQPSYFGKGPERDMFDTLALYVSVHILNYQPNQLFVSRPHIHIDWCTAIYGSSGHSSCDTSRRFPR